MEEIDWQEYWWSRVTGPREVVYSVISALRGKKSAVLHIPQDLPWRQELRRSVRNNLESIPGLEDLAVYPIDIEDECANDVDPGRLLLDRYALREDRSRFRAGGTESIQDYLLRKNVMLNKLVWIKGIGPNASQKWVDFCEKWKPKDITDGMFVIEVREQSQINRNNNVSLVRYEDCVSEYDVQLFSSLMIGSSSVGGLSSSWKRYGAALTTHLCGTDAEIAHNFVLRHNFKSDDPIATIEEIDESGFFDRRGSGSHVLALFRDGNTTALKERIWAAQVEVLFPLIERQRLEIVDMYRSQFELEVRKGLEQFDNPVEKPEDVELGTMVYMVVTHRLNVPECDVRNRIHILRDCRNLLAHRDICNLDQVALLLER